MVQGGRDREEDAVAVDFPVGASNGFAVLADGMGGHEAGDVASRIVVTEIFSELKLQTLEPNVLERDIQQTLCNATRDANLCLDHVSRQSLHQSLMGSTLLVPVLFEDRLYWISVGDSPLFLFRDGALVRLNETHSMAAQIDLMHEQGKIDADEAANHPDRQCLTSVLAGHDIAQIDCPDRPLQLREDDIVVAASDGLEFLSDAQIADVLRANITQQSAEISAALLREIARIDDEDQDNVSLCVIKVTRPMALTGQAIVSEQTGHRAPVGSSVTVMASQTDTHTSVFCMSKTVSA